MRVLIVEVRVRIVLLWRILGIFLADVIKETLEVIIIFYLLLATVIFLTNWHIIISGKVLRSHRRIVGRSSKVGFI